MRLACLRGRLARVDVRRGETPAKTAGTAAPLKLNGLSDFGSLASVRQRLDQLLVERGLCDSREKAKRAVMAGLVRVNGQVAEKPSNSVQESDDIQLATPEKFVSRGGFKLEHALGHFGIDVRGTTAIDL